MTPQARRDAAPSGGGEAARGSLDADRRRARVKCYAGAPNSARSGQVSVCGSRIPRLISVLCRADWAMGKDGWFGGRAKANGWDAERRAWP